MSDDRFSFRWGIPWLDMGFLQVPNAFFKHYSELKVTKDEYLFILHLAVYKYESPQGVAQPSLGTIALQMGISRRQVRRLRESLENGGWLTVRLRPGETSLYDFQAFSLAMMKMEELALRRRLGDPDQGGRTPVSEGGRTPTSEGVGHPRPRGRTPTSEGVGHPRPPKNKQETEKTQQHGPVVVVSPPAAGEGSGADQSAAGRQGLAGDMPAGEREKAERSSDGQQSTADHVPVWEINGSLQDVGIGQEQGIELIEKYGAERIQEVLAAVRAQGDKIRDPAAWVITALRRKFKVTTPAVDDGQAEEQRKKRKTCAWYRNPGLGSCPSADVDQSLFLWCEGCEKMAGG